MSTSQPGYLAERYSRRVALRHELLYGRGYQGPGEEEVFADLTRYLKLSPGLRVLDVGSGLGGDAFRLAARFGVSVLGLDLSPAMTAVSRERAREVAGGDVAFVTGDVTHAPELGPDAFDVVWTRDCVVFVRPEAKPAVWRRLLATLRPGGQLLVTDYCLGPAGGSTEHVARMAAWEHHMLPPTTYREMLRAAGFIEVGSEDRTPYLLANLIRGRARLTTERESFLREMDEDEYNGLLTRWNRKIDSCRDGLVVWTVLTAKRSSSTR